MLRIADQGRGIPDSTMLVFITSELGTNPIVTELRKLSEVKVEGYPAPEKENTSASSAKRPRCAG